MTGLLNRATLDGPVIGDGLYDAYGHKILGLSPTTGALNYVDLGNTDTTPVVIAAKGPGTNIAINLVPKGSGGVQINADTILTRLAVQSFANKTWVDPSDQTKGMELIMPTAATGTTLSLRSNHSANRTIVLPDADTTLVGTGTTQALSNKTIVDPGDVTKAWAWNLAGATTGKTVTISSAHTANRTIALPDATTTLVGTGTTQALSSKTIVDPSDVTKVWAWDLGGATTGKTVTIKSNHSSDITLTLPTTTGTLANFAQVGATLINEQVLAVDQAQVDFNTIDQTYRSLLIVLAGRSDQATTQQPIYIQFNADTGNNYYEQRAGASGATASGAEQLGISQPQVLYVPGTSSPANAMGVGYILIPDYARTAWSKMTVGQGAGFGNTTTGTLFVNLVTAIWTGTAAITTVRLKPTAGNFKTNTVVSLYGLD